MTAPLATRLKARPPFAHGDGDYYGLAWAALEWLEQTVTADMTTLETGAGASTIVFAAAGASHTTISPDAEEHRRIAERCGEERISADGVRFVAESSTEALTGDWEYGELDLALIDGAHSFPYPAIDWFFVEPHLKVGAVLAVDDSQLAPVNQLVRYLRHHPAWRMERVLGGRVSVFRKLSDAGAPVEPNWTGGRLDDRPRFDYLAPVPRLATWVLDRVVTRGPLRPLVRWNTRRRLRR